MIENAHETRLIEHLPRNLRKFARVQISSPTPRTFTEKELERLWAEADERMRAWICLALNAGMGQKDISDLRVGEIHFESGYIERERSKTGIAGRWKAWDVTISLLRAQIPADAGPDDRVFLNRNSGPLVLERHDDGKLSKSDAVRNAFERLRVRAGLERGRGFYCLRKTAATMIESINPAVTSLFLGHSERGMKRHYASRDWATLDETLRVLDHRLQLGPLEISAQQP